MRLAYETALTTKGCGSNTVDARGPSARPAQEGKRGARGRRVMRPVALRWVAMAVVRAERPATRREPARADSRGRPDAALVDRAREMPRPILQHGEFFGTREQRREVPGFSLSIA